MTMDHTYARSLGKLRVAIHRLRTKSVNGSTRETRTRETREKDVGTEFWQQGEKRKGRRHWLYMDVMAPALTDANVAAHSAALKLPASPANPGLGSTCDPTSPDLPDIYASTKLGCLQLDTCSTLGKLLNGKNGIHLHHASYVSVNNIKRDSSAIGPTYPFLESKSQSVIDNILKLQGNHCDFVVAAGINEKNNKMSLSVTSDKDELGRNGHITNSFNDSYKIQEGFGDQVEGEGKSGTFDLKEANSCKEGTMHLNSVVDDLDFGEAEPNAQDLSLEEKGSRTIVCEDITDKDDFSMEHLDIEIPRKRVDFQKPENSGNRNNPFCRLELQVDSKFNASLLHEEEQRLEEFCPLLAKKIKQRHSDILNRKAYLARRLERLQALQTGLHAKEQMGSFCEEMKVEKFPTVSVGCAACREMQTNNNHTSTVKCEKHSSAKPTYEKTMTVNQRLASLQEKRKETVQDFQVTCKELHRCLLHSQDSLDAEATDSSSDEDDCLEGIVSTRSSPPVKSLARFPLHKRAIWKWAGDRASIASRWTWLQAQVSDLEYRIRQQSDIHKQIKANKGSVTLGMPFSKDDILKSRHQRGKKISLVDSKIGKEGNVNASISPSNLSTLLSNLDKQTAKLSESLSNGLSYPSGLSSEYVKTDTTKQLNGILHHTTANDRLNESSLSSGTSHIPAQHLNTDDKLCARARPVQYVRKRKIIRTKGLHSHHRQKARRLTLVSCDCCPAVNSCVMCGGRYNSVKTVNPSCMSLGQRLANLDHGYHPVLSFPHDIPLSLHFETLLRKSENERRLKLPKKRKRPPPVQLHGKKRDIKRLRKLRRKQKLGSSLEMPLVTKSNSHEDENLKLRKMESLRFDSNILKKNSETEDQIQIYSPIQLSTEVNSEKDTGRSISDLKKKRYHSTPHASQKPRERSSSLPDVVLPLDISTPLSTPPDSKPSTPVPSLSNSLSSTSLHSLKQSSVRKSVSGDAYDIDNIVIPYSILASTRVEKLHYKEIDTPGWRILEIDENETPRLSEEIEEENLADAEFNQRHTEFEIIEKKKFMAILTAQGVPGQRSRRSRNNSVQSNSDPLSPNGDNILSSMGFSPLSHNISPLATPEEKIYPHPLDVGTARSLRSTSSEKRRISQGSDSHQSSFDEEEIFCPWEKRCFPLSEDDVLELGTCGSQNGIEERIFSPVKELDSSISVVESEDESSADDSIEDPNDPDWIVSSKKKAKQAKISENENFVGGKAASGKKVDHKATS